MYLSTQPCKTKFSTKRLGSRLPTGVLSRILSLGRKLYKALSGLRGMPPKKKLDLKIAVLQNHNHIRNLPEFSLGMRTHTR